MKYMLSFVDTELEDVPYFVGAELTAADVMMTSTFTTMRYFLDYDLSPYPHIVAYLKRIEARPAYQKAMAQAGPKVGT
jgi:glutathione S-transferase